MLVEKRVWGTFVLLLAGLLLASSAHASPPNISSVILNSTSPFNFSSGNLTLYVNGSDADGDNITYYGDWKRNGTAFVGQLWNATFNGGFTDQAYDLALDPQGNIYVTGKVFVAGNYDDVGTVKYNNQGQMLWNATFHIEDNDQGNAIAVDSSGNVYVAGGTSNTSSTWRYLLVKYNSSGQKQWNVSYYAGGSNWANGVSIDGQDNVIITGQSTGTPNVLKYNSSGQIIWNMTFAGGIWSIPSDVAADAQSNLYITGYTSPDGVVITYRTVKVNSSGQQLWNATYARGTRSYATRVTSNAQGRVYVTGYGNGSNTNDFDTVVYNSSGGQLWNASHDNGMDDMARDIALDSLGNIYVTGYSKTGTLNNIFTIKYNSSGQEQGNSTFDSGADDFGRAISIDGSGNRYLVGYNNRTDNGNYIIFKEKSIFIIPNNSNGIVLADTLVSSLLDVGDNWTACVTPNDGIADGSSVCSNSIIIQNEAQDTDGDGDPDVTDCDDTNASVLNPRNNLDVNRSITLCPGIYNINASGMDLLLMTNADNVKLDCNGATIIGNGSGTAVRMTRHNLTLINCNLYDYDEVVSAAKFGPGQNLNISNSRFNATGNDAVSIDSFPGAWIYNISSFSQNGRGAYVFGSPDTRIISSALSSNASDGFATDDPANHRVNVSRSSLLSIAGCGARIMDAGSNDSFEDSVINGSTGVCDQGGNAGTHYFINTTINNVSLTGTNTHYRIWYLDVKVNSTINESLASANVTLTYSNGTIIFTELTDAAGRIATKHPLQYIQNSTSQTNFTDMVLTVAKSNYTGNQTTFNITASTTMYVTLAGDIDGDGDPDTTDCAPTDPTVLSPYDDLWVTTNIALCPGNHSVNDKGEDGVIIINNSDVTVDFNGAVLEGSEFGKGVVVEGAKHRTTVKNGVITRFAQGVEWNAGTLLYIYNASVLNMTLLTNAAGIEIGYNNHDSNITLCNFSGNAIALHAYGSNILGGYAANNLSVLQSHFDTWIVINDSSIGRLQNARIIDSRLPVDSAAVYLRYGGLSMQNTSFNQTGVTITDTGTLGVGWYADTFVNSSSGAVAGANVSYYYANGTLDTTLLTNATGQLPRITLTEYVENQSGKSYLTNYSVNITKTGYQAIVSSVNVTSSASRTFTILEATPNATGSRISPSPNAYADDILSGYCNGTAGTGANVTYIWTLYANFAFNTNGTSASVPSGTEMNVFNWAAPIAGVNYILGCQANDTLALSAQTNSTSTTTLVRGTIPTATLFDGSTTNFSSISNYHNISAIILERSGLGKIVWSGGINASGADFDANVLIQSNSLFVNSSALPNLNRTAQLSIFSLPYLRMPVLYKDGSVCASCSDVSYAGGDLTFNVTGFSNYSAGANANLSIWDNLDAGMPYANLSNNETGTQKYFYANYSNITSGAPVNATMGGNCSINFSDSLAYMAFDDSKQLWEYHRTFTANITYGYLISCNSTDYEPLNATDDLTIAADSLPPSLIIYSPLNTTYQNASILVSFNATDTIGVDSLWFNNGTANTTFTGNTTVNLSDGSHTFTFYANDTFGNTNSTDVTFSIDTAAPGISIVAPVEGSFTNAESVLLNISAPDASSVWFNWNGTNTTYTATVNVSFPEANHTLVAWANDSVGNVNSTQVSFVVDRTNPWLSFVDPTTVTGNYSQDWIYGNTSASDDRAGFNDTGIIVFLYNLSGLVSSAPSNESVLAFFTSLSDGEYWLNATAVDQAGNRNSTSTHYIVLDTVAPDLLINAPANASFSSASELLVNITAIGADQVLYSWNGTNASYLAPVNVTFPEGNHTLTAWAIDSANNTNTSSAEFVVDRTPPLIAFESPSTPQGTLSQNWIYANLSLSDDRSGFYSGMGIVFSLRNSTDLIYTVGVSAPHQHNATNLSDGTYTMNATSQDKAGNRNQTETRIIVLDTQAPNMTLISPADGAAYNNLTVLVSINATDATDVWFNWNGTNASYSNKVNVTFPEGNHTLTASANDSAGNINTTTNAFIIDITAPSIELMPNTTAPGPTNLDTITAWVNASDAGSGLSAGAGIVLSLHNSSGGLVNGFAWSCSASPCNFTWTGLAEGNYTLNATSLDTAGNKNFTNSLSYLIDQSPPPISLLSPLNTTYTNANVTVLIDAPGNQSVWFDWNGTNATYAGETTVIFPQGTTVLHAWANDSAGNVNYTNVTFFVDSVAPALAIVSPQNITYVTSEILLNISSDSPTIWFDWNGTNATYTNALNITFLQGTTVLHAWANDSLGNLNYTNVTFFVDSIAPDIAIVSPQNMTYTNATILVDISAQGNQSVWFDWNGTNSTFTDAVNITFPEGSTTLTAWANDSVGNINSTQVVFSVDTIPPDLIILSPLNITYTNATILVALSAPGNQSVWFDWNGTNTTFTNPVNVTFPEGNSTLWAFANDSFGNVNATSVTFTVHTGPPTVIIHSPQNVTYANASVLLNLSAFDPVNVSSIWYFNGTANVSYTVETYLAYVDGYHTFDAFANDSAGNIGFAQVNFSVDTVPPQISILSPLAGNYSAGLLGLEISAPGNQSAWFDWNGTNATYAGSVNIAFPDGDILLVAYANDSVGNLNSTSVSFIVDSTPPVIDIVSPLAITYANSTVLLRINATDLHNVSSIWFFNGTGNETYTGEMNLTLVDGVKNLTVYANDTFGNLANASVSFSIDTISPNISVVTPAEGSFTNAILTLLNISAPGASSVWFNWNGSNTTYTLPLNISFPEQNHTLSAWANDSAGNTNSTQVSFVVDRTNPSVMFGSLTTTSGNHSQNWIFANTSATDDRAGFNASGLIVYLYNTTGLASQSASNESQETMFAGLPDGMYWLNATATDRAGNRNSTTTNIIVLDTQAPPLAIISPQNASYANATIALNISSDSPSVWFNWNGTNATYAGESTITFPQGSTTVHAWANDSAGNLNYTNVTFFVDSIAPDIVIVSPQNQTYTNATILVALSAPGNQSVWFDWNGTNVTYTNAVNVTFPQGTTVLHAWANDSLGNVNYTNVTFFVDSMAPTLSILSPLNATYTTTDILLNISSDSSTIWFNWNGTNATYAGESTITFPQGSTTVHAWANDSLGNLNYSNVTFFIDSMPPDIVILSPQNQTYTNATVLVSISAPGNQSVWFNWNGTNTTFTNPVNVTFPEGNSTLWAFANDSFGNVNATSVTFTVHTGPPTVVIHSPQNVTYANASVLINLSAFDPVNVSSLWFFNGTANVSYTVETYLAYVDGYHTFDAFANDSAGNIGFAQVNFSVDTVPPQISILSPLAGNYSASLFGLEISAPGNQSVWFDWNGTNATYAGIVSIPFPDGDILLVAFANDSVGNLNSTSVSFIVDTLPPVINIVSPLAITYANSTVLLRINATDLHNISRIWFFNGTGDETYAGETNLTLVDGAKNLTVYANDTFGNLANASVSFSIDTTPPDVFIITPQNTTYNTSLLLVNISAPGSSSIWYNWNGTNATFNGALNLTFPEGSTTLTAWANDSVGNINSTQVTFATDTIAPSINIVTPQNITYLDASVLVNITAGSYQSIWFEWNGTIAPYTTETNVTFPEGNTTLRAFANDSVNNINSTHVNFTVDTLPPNVIVNSPQAITYSNRTILINFTATDPAGISAYWYSNGTANSSYTIPVNTSSLPDGGYTYIFYANDTLGHIGATAVSFTVDANLPPQLSGSSLIPLPANTTTDLTVAATYSDPEGTNGNVSILVLVDGMPIEYQVIQGVANGSIVNLTQAHNYTHGQNVTFVIWAFDGKANSSQTNLSTIIINLLPSATTPLLSPQPIAKPSSLVVNSTYTDGDGDSGIVNFTLFVNNVPVSTQPISVGNGSDAITSFSSLLFNKSQTLIVQAELSDGIALGQAVNSSSIVVQNAVPMIASSRIAPLQPIANSTINGYCNTTDADNDNVTYTYTWYRNGSVNLIASSSSVAQGVETLIGNRTNLVKGDTWILQCSASDGTNVTTSLNSTMITVGNTPPLISGLSYSPIIIFDNKNITGQVTYADADNDTGTLHWQLYVNGTMQQYGNSTAVPSGTTASFTFDEQYYSINDTLIIEAWADDGVNMTPAMNTSSVAVQLGNRGPNMTSVSITQGTNSSNSILVGSCLATDPESNMVNYSYSWYLDDALYLSNSTGYVASGAVANVSIISGMLTRGQNWTLQCLANDSLDTSETVNSTTHIVLNTLPYLENTAMQPLILYPGLDITGETNYFDDDDDNGTVQMDLYVNGAPTATYLFSSVADGTFLNHTFTSLTLVNGDLVTLSVSADDGSTSALQRNVTKTVYPVCVGSSRNFVCGDNVNESCTILGDMVSVSNTCFTVTTPGVTIDGNGFRIDNVLGSVGVHVRASNALVRNLTLGNFTQGIIVNGSQNTTLQDIVVQNPLAASGHAILNWQSNTTMLTRVSLDQPSALYTTEHDGGLTAIDCTFSGNITADCNAATLPLDTSRIIELRNHTQFSGSIVTDPVPAGCQGTVYVTRYARIHATDARGAIVPSSNAVALAGYTLSNVSLSLDASGTSGIVPLTDYLVTGASAIQNTDPINVSLLAYPSAIGQANFSGSTGITDVTVSLPVWAFSGSVTDSAGNAKNLSTQLSNGNQSWNISSGINGTYLLLVPSEQVYNISFAGDSFTMRFENLNLAGVTEFLDYEEVPKLLANLGTSIRTIQVYGFRSNISNAIGEMAFLNYPTSNIDFLGNVNVYRCPSWNFLGRTCNTGWTLMTTNSRDLTGINASIAAFSAFALGETVTTSTTTVINTGGGGGGGGGGTVNNYNMNVNTSQLSKEVLSEIQRTLREEILGRLELVTTETNLITKQLYPGESTKTKVTLRNAKAEPITLSLSFAGEITDLVSAQKMSYTLQPNEEVSVPLTITAGFDIRPNLYTGDLQFLSGGQAVKKIPIEVRVLESREKLIDVKLQPLSERVAPGSTLRAQLDLFNLGRAGSIDTKVLLQVIDPETDQIIVERQVLAMVETSTTSIENLQIPQDAPLKRYIIKGVAEYNYRGQDLQSSVISYVTVGEPWYRYALLGVPVYWWLYLLLIVAVIALISLSYYSYAQHKRRQRKYAQLIELKELPKPVGRSAFVGNIAETSIRAFMNIDDLQTHTILAGSTGSGKTIAAQLLAEEALRNNAAVIVFDPSAQWSGFLRKLEDKRMLRKYDEFLMKPAEARSFPGNVYQLNSATQVINLKEYMKPGEISVFTLNKLDPQDIDLVVASTVRQVFKSSFEEAQGLKVLIIYDEVHRLLPKFGGTGQGFIQLERAVREFRKWGIGLVLISQVMSDFVGEIKANISTEVQMRTRDEGDLDRIKNKYGEDIMKDLIKASVGVGMLQNANYNKGRPYLVKFRPILHSVSRLSDADLELYNKYNLRTDDYGYQIEQLKGFKVDTFDVELEFKLAVSKIKSGNFSMADLYLEGIQPKLDSLWAKLGKRPVKRAVQTLTAEELEKEMQIAQKERERYLKSIAKDAKPAPEAASPAGQAQEGAPVPQNAQPIAAQPTAPADGAHAVASEPERAALQAQSPPSATTPPIALSKSGADMDKALDKLLTSMRKEETKIRSELERTERIEQREESEVQAVEREYRELLASIEELHELGHDTRHYERDLLSVPTDIEYYKVKQNKRHMENIKARVKKVRDTVQALHKGDRP